MFSTLSSISWSPMTWEKTTLALAQSCPSLMESVGNCKSWDSVSFVWVSWNCPFRENYPMGFSYKMKPTKVSLLVDCNFINLCRHYRKQYETPQKIRTRTAVWFSISTSGYSKQARTLIQKDIYTLMFIAALLTISQMWKPPGFL